MKLGHFVRKASKHAIIDGVKHIKKYYVPQSKIISDRNPLETNCIKAYKKHADATKTYAISSSHVTSYVAASSLSHLLDGWMYLSNSFTALLNGDEGASIHLAYYAELRSAMAILASEGIGVFDEKHVGVFSDKTNGEYPKNYFKGVPPNQTYKRPSARTHVFVWDAMEKWTNSAYKPDPDILKIFSVKGKNFYELMEFFHPTATSLRGVEIVKQWLKDWCFDIRAYRSDRDNRNVVSYRPQRIKDFGNNLDFKQIINELTGFWTAISPIQEDKFSILDLYLLRKLFQGLDSQIPQPKQSYYELVENAFNQLGLHDETMIKLLCSKEQFVNDHIIFTHANTKSTTAIAIIARATLLLRIAVGLVSQLYKSGGMKKEELKFIWENYGLNSGFWTNGEYPEDFDNLWVDVQPHIQDLDNRVNATGADNTIFKIRSDKPEELGYFTQVSRTCLWGISF